MIFLALLIAAPLAVIFFMLPLHWRLFFTLVLSVPQLYIFQILGADIPIALLCALTLIPDTAGIIIKLKNKKILFTLALICVIQAISLAWSINVSMGARDVVYGMIFIIIAAAVYKVVLTHPLKMGSIVFWMMLFVSFEAILIIIFRLNPELEVTLTLSPIASYFLGKNVLDGLLAGVRNNFYDPVKSGGFFINANAAACYIGLASFMAWGWARLTKSKILTMVAALCWISVFFTGSKAGFLLALAVPMLTYFIYIKHQSKKAALFFVILSCVGTIVCTLAISYTLLDNSQYVSATGTAAESRFIIWDYASNAFLRSPILGQGYGGWEADYVKYTDYFLPPHNTIVYMWSKSGVIASILSIMFIFYVIQLNLKCMKSFEPVIRIAGTTSFMVSAWLFMHGMGENFGLLGEPHQEVFLPVMIGTLYGLIERQRIANINLDNSSQSSD
ncbi:O-antigen ligase family protein [Rahnella victoriana]|uniref:O-antigen ligase family protein n=1 Tax=Rahnella victoriana TaxID=1510570 RepID=A0ABS0DQ93_9GAMM|nr:O-antigen ligase family protein [Rahnella victoriana]MBF7956061.1 O-antigen ligase family protein [Rahnella victoriana]